MIRCGELADADSALRFGGALGPCNNFVSGYPECIISLFSKLSNAFIHDRDMLHYRVLGGAIGISLISLHSQDVGHIHCLLLGKQPGQINQKESKQHRGKRNHE